MAANTNDSGSERVNFYGISYGHLTHKTKELPIGKEETTEQALKSIAKKVQDIDLRNAYVVKEGNYPYTVFYKSIDGIIKRVEACQKDFGMVLEVEILDKDDESSIISVKLYSKYAENLLNRIANSTPNTKLRFTPYAIPNDYVPDQRKPFEKIKYYISGVSLKYGLEKINPKFKHEDLPPTERIMNNEGVETTSRVKRVNFLLNFVKENLPFDKFAVNNQVEEQNAASQSNRSYTPTPNVIDDEDDLPF